MHTLELLGATLVLTAILFRRPLLGALSAQFRASRTPEPTVMRPWAMRAFALAPGEVPTRTWRASCSGTQAWAATTSDGRFVVGTEAGENLARLARADLAAGALEAASGADHAGMVELTIVPAHGPVVVVALESKAAKELRKWASRA
ncbi:hypothetical protein [Demequina gelatinilytica]|uniref:hypothetical protein n=1 Tax=Demequina gelatinilytica TaxID=1638980 RepID=UPI0007864C8B|nr:hypothetical protein [Demequina gelatinilytica]